nr:unnamed protein product [Digitaria exilis]
MELIVRGCAHGLENMTWLSWSNSAAADRDETSRWIQCCGHEMGMRSGAYTRRQSGGSGVKRLSGGRPGGGAMVA